ncbi:hypothetical protein [Burkholderia cenocepacia]|uniref:Uncharacterized protein n=1 Tax=Burkholderia cenocepacia TaxID=95486 RepID=A0A3Q9FDK8_9BURK|nr:hypothetical protein [Burkholderia cenocepacia]AZQ55205.1 hypothetical protein D5R55_30615 [Burkholderia cenocepacia]
MEFLYFIQRSDRIFTGDPVGARPALSISEMTCCRCDSGRRACGQGFRRDIAHADAAEAISSDQPILLMQDKSLASACRIETRRNLQGRAIITHRPFRRASHAFFIFNRVSP